MKKITKSKTRSVDYQSTLIKRLKDHDYAVEYLNTAIQEGSKGDPESKKLFLQALRNVAEAQGSLSDIAKRARVRRESLYRILSKRGNPELNSLASLLSAMGFRLHIQ